MNHTLNHSFTLRCFAAVLAAAASHHAAAATVGFEDLALPAGGTYAGAAGATNFASGGATFNNSFTDWGGGLIFWAGWAVSNHTDTTTPGFGNQFSAIPGTAVSGNQFGVAYQDAFIPMSPRIDFGGAVVVDGAYFTNTTYAYLSMLNGDGFAKRFGGTTGVEPDWFQLTVTGKNGVSNTGTVRFNLADFRPGNSAADLLVSRWTWLDLAPLGAVTAIEFSMASTDNGPFGMNTPAYFAMDELSYAPVAAPVPVPGALPLLGIGLGLGFRLARRRA